MLAELINTDKITQNKFYRLSAILGIAVLIMLIGIFVYITGGTTSFVHLMYIPIFLTVFLFGIKSGIIASVVAGLVLGPYMPMVVKDGIMQEPRSWIFRIIMFITIVLVVGLLLQYIKNFNESEKKRAYIDIITGYPNGNKLVEDLNKMINEQKHKTISLIIFEYKNKEMINQYVNHEIGSKSFINLINAAYDFFCPCHIYSASANKFIVIAPDYDQAHAYYMANEFTDVMKKPMFVDTLPISIVLKGGIVNYPLHSNELNDILLKLDKVLNQTDKTQKIITLYDNRIESESIKYYNTLVSLYYSLQNDMFNLVYQPKIDIKTNQFIGVEALLRIKYNKSENISISELINMAEDVGFISEITRWVINASILQIKNWLLNGIKIKISINLSSVDLNNNSIVIYTRNCLEKHGVAPSMIEFELTERSIIKDEQRALSVLNRIKKEGIKISLDDYGTGHNSLNYLVNASFPFDYIKMDKAFTDNIIEVQNEVLAEGIIKTAHVLGIEVVAEGVETKEQVEILKSINCDIIQGYYYCEPLSPESLIEHIKNSGYNL